jgi:hypothetical protein
MTVLLALLLSLAQDEAVVLRTVEAPLAESFPDQELAPGEIGVVLGATPETADLLGAAGFSAAPGVRGRITFVPDPKAGGSGTVVWISSLSREQTAAALRDAKGLSLCIVTGRGGGDPDPVRIGETWMVQAPGATGLWGRIELRAGAVTNRFGAPDGKRSEKVAALKKQRGFLVDPVGDLREGAKPGGDGGAARVLDTGNRACRLRILGMTERASYGAKMPGAGKRLFVLDAEFENIIPLTLIQTAQVPTIYKVKDLADHLYLVVNGVKASRLPADAAALPGHVPTVGFALERLGSRIRGNLVYEIPADAIRLDLRFYDYAHGHMTLLLRPGDVPEAKPLFPSKENEVLEAAIFRVERLREFSGKGASEGMTYLMLDLRARSHLFTEADATAFDPKAKPGEKLQVGTVSDWTDLRKHLNLLVDGTRSVGPADVSDLGEAPRFLPDLLTGGTAVFLVPEKAESLELRCDFPNARLPGGQVVHPAPLVFLLEGKRPDAPLPAPLVEIDDEIFKVAVLGQKLVSEVQEQKSPAGSKFLVLDVLVKGNGTAGEQFQTADQLRYATEKGVQLAAHDASYHGPTAAAKLLLVPKGEQRRFDLVFSIPAADLRPRLAYRGVTKAQIVALPALEGAPAPEAAKRLCPKCKAEAGPNDKFCAECGTKFDGK